MGLGWNAMTLDCDDGLLAMAASDTTTGAELRRNNTGAETQQHKSLVQNGRRHGHDEIYAQDITFAAHVPQDIQVRKNELQCDQKWRMT